MKRLMESLVLSLALMTWVGCSTPGDRPQASAPTDDDIERTIQNRIRDNPSLAEANVDVDADVSQNTVTVSGTVPSQTARTHVVEIVKSTDPKFTINDKIDVKPREVPLAQYTEDMARTTRDSAQAAGEKLGDSLEDAWIHTKLSAKLATNDATPARKINVDVVNNVVTLRGDVATEEAKREAARVATETDGVRKVNNLLKVRP